MATNYFENLGFGQNLRQGMSDLAQVGYMKQAEAQKAQEQAKAEQKALLQFQNEQQKQRAAQGAGAFYNALNSNNPQAALQIAKQYEQDIATLGDPSFTVANIAEMLKTPEGTNQLKQMAAGTVQMAAGPQEFAKYVQAQAPKQPEQMTAYQQASTDLRKQELEQKRLEAEAQKKVKELENQLSKESNDLKRQELQTKIDTAQVDLQKKKADAAAAEQTKAAGNQNLIEAYAQTKALLNNPALPQIIGTVTTSLPTVRGESQDLINQATRLQSLLTADNLKLMSGILTDKDIAFLTNIASGLNVVEGGIKGSESGVKNRLAQIMKTLERGAKEKGIDLTQSTQQDQTQQPDLTEADIMAQYGLQ